MTDWIILTIFAVGYIFFRGWEWHYTGNPTGRRP